MEKDKAMVETASKKTQAIDDDLKFSYFHLGMKSNDNENHWIEQCVLNPNKKTLLCLGGGGTIDARAANGNCNCFVDVLGLADEEKSELQLVSCYRPDYKKIRNIQQNPANLIKNINDDYKREILQKFMPFMAQRIDGKFERLTNECLAKNFRNIMIQAHCAGVDDLPKFTKIFKQAMTKLGYSPAVQKHALKQIICVTNNSQREFTDDLGFTIIHRYSLFAGQTSASYDGKYSHAYPLFINQKEVFEDKNGHNMAFIQMKPNEMFMVYDKIAKDIYDRAEYFDWNYSLQEVEHNEAFWMTNPEELTTVGKYQARLMAKLGRFWYNNRQEVPDVLHLLKRITDNSALQAQFRKAVNSGKKLKTEKNNLLVNHHILKSEWNKFKNQNIPALKSGIYKLLSDKYKE